MVRERLKVLIVDDDPFITEMYRLRLEADGYEVITARDGEEGLARAGTDAPGFICLDYRLPASTASRCSSDSRRIRPPIDPCDHVEQRRRSGSAGSWTSAWCAHVWYQG